MISCKRARIYNSIDDDDDFEEEEDENEMKMDLEMQMKSMSDDYKEEESMKENLAKKLNMEDEEELNQENDDQLNQEGEDQLNQDQINDAFDLFF